MAADPATPLLVKRAKLAKAPGILTISRQSLTWKPNDPGANGVIEVSISAITNQQRAKGKPLLRLVTASKPYVMELYNEAEVDVVVEALAPLLQAQRPTSAPGAPAAPDAQADLKRSLLQNDPYVKLSAFWDLRLLHEQLVVPGVLSEAEFWRPRAAQLPASASAGAQQRRGLPSTMLTDVQPSADGRTDTVKVKLTAAMVHQTFAEKPHVKRAYQANVPTRMMTHAAFWSKYLRHQYRQQEMRRRLAAGGTADKGYMEDEEFFARYEREDDAAGPSQAEGAVKPADDLTAEEHDGMRDGYGVYHSSRQDPVDNSKPAKNRLVQDINRHAAVVMEGTPGSLPADAADAAITLAAAPVGAGARQSSRGLEAANATGQPPQSASGLDDLRKQPAPQFSELHIQDPRHAMEPTAPDNTSGSAAVSMQDVHQALLAIDPAQLASAFPSDSLAMQVLAETTFDNEGGSGGGGAAEMLLPQVKSVLRQLVLTANELLRHFWPCFPLANAQRKTKAQRIAQALSEHLKRMRDMESAAIGVEQRQVMQLLRPVEDAIEAALAKLASAKADTPAAM